VSLPAGHDDDLADLLAMVTVARENSMTPSGREALRALGENCDRLGVIACAIKLLAQLADDAGFCPGHFREYAARAIARLSRSRRRAGTARPQDGSAEWCHGTCPPLRCAVLFSEGPRQPYAGPRRAPLAHYGGGLAVCRCIQMSRAEKAMAPGVGSRSPHAVVPDGTRRRHARCADLFRAGSRIWGQRRAPNLLGPQATALTVRRSGGQPSGFSGSLKSGNPGQEGRGRPCPFKHGDRGRARPGQRAGGARRCCARRK